MGQQAGRRAQWRKSIENSRPFQTLAKWWRRVEFGDAVLGVWDRIPWFVKSAMRFAITYTVLQGGAGIAARGLEVGRDNTPWIVVGAFATTATVWVIVEHSLAVRRQHPPPLVASEGMREGVGTITVAEPVFVPEDHNAVQKDTDPQDNAVITTHFGSSHIIGEKSVQLVYGFYGRETVTLECVVADPRGHISRASRSPELGLRYYRLSLQYPNDFYSYTGDSDRPPPLEPGCYRIAWKQIGWLDLGPPSFLSSAATLIVGGRDRYVKHETEVGTDTFTIE